MTKDQILKAIADYFGDTKRPIEICLDELEEIREDLDSKISCSKETM